MLEDCNMIEPLRSHSALLCQFSYSSDNDHSLSHILHLLLNHNWRARQFWRGQSLWLFLTSSAVWQKEIWILSLRLSLAPHNRVLNPDSSLQNITNFLTALFVWFQDNIVKALWKYAKGRIMKNYPLKKYIWSKQTQTKQLTWSFTI